MGDNTQTHHQLRIEHHLHTAGNEMRKKEERKRPRVTFRSRAIAFFKGRGEVTFAKNKHFHQRPSKMPPLKRAQDA